jgi:RsiW-degrading membrane proteinase PrsW (M82 family)
MNDPTTSPAETPESLDRMIDSAAAALGFQIAEAWRPAVRANLAVSLKFARFVDDFVLSDETEPASIFKA